MLPPDLDDLMRDQGVDVDYPSDPFEAWLQKHGYEGNEVYLAGCVFPKRSVEVYPYYFLPEAKVRTTNGPRAGFPKPFQDGLLIIGLGCAGDFLAVDLRDQQGVGLINHEKISDDDPIRKAFASFADNIEELVVLINKVKAPGDYAEAAVAHKKWLRQKAKGGKTKKK